MLNQAGLTKKVVILSEAERSRRIYAPSWTMRSLGRLFARLRRGLPAFAPA